jgi:hypothetical protein
MQLSRDKASNRSLQFLPPLFLPPHKPQHPNVLRVISRASQQVIQQALAG